MTMATSWRWKDEGAHPITYPAWFVGLAVCGACHAVPPPASPFPTAADALASMKNTYRCERGVHGEAKVDHFSSHGRVRGRVLLFAVRPDDLRLDLLAPPPISSAVSTLTTFGGDFQLLDLRAKRFYEGPATPCNIARLTEVPLEAQALVKLLGGEAPLLVHDGNRLEMAWDRRGYYVIRIPSTRQASEEVHLSPTPEDFGKPWQQQRVRVLDVRVSQRGQDLYHAELDEHRWTSTAAPLVDPDGLEPPIPPSGPSCTVEVPHRIHIESPEGDQDMLFRYEKVELNPPLPAGVFTQPIPGGIEVVPVSCP
jgi:hypothetical protein